MKFLLLTAALIAATTATSSGYDAQDEPSFLQGYEVDWEEAVEVWSTSDTVSPDTCTHNWYVIETFIIIPKMDAVLTLIYSLSSLC